MSPHTYQNNQNTTEWQHQMLANTWRNWITRTLLVGIASDTATLKNSLAVCYEIKHAATVNPATTLLNFYPREMKTNVHTKPAHKCYSSFIYLKQPQTWKPRRNPVSFNRQTNDGSMDFYSGIRRNRLWTHTNGSPEVLCGVRAARQQSTLKCFKEKPSLPYSCKPEVISKEKKGTDGT